MDDFIAGIDLGTSSVKVLCINKSGEIFRAGRAYEVESTDLTGQNAASWWKAIKEAFKTLSRQMDLKSVTALSLTAQVGTYLLFNQTRDEKDIKVTSWKSAFGTDQLRTLKNRFSVDYFLKHISMPHPDLISYPAPKILWFKECLAEDWNQTEKILQPKDYLYYKLTGIFASDPYTWRGLANLHDKRFHDAFLQEIGITGEQLPALFEPSECPGHLLPPIAEELGLRCGMPVFTGCNDFFASLLGMGILEGGQCFDMTGTSEHIGVIVDKPEYNTPLVSGPYFKDYIHYGVTANSGSSMDWAFRTFGRGIDLMDVVKDMQDIGKKLRPPLFLPYMQGERAPIWDPKARGVFFGLDCSTESKDLFYSIMEGVVFSLYHIWSLLGNNERFEEKTVVRVAGGAAFDRTLNRLKASLFKIPFAVMKEKDSAALGTAMFAAVGAGWFPSVKHASDGWVAIDHILEPDNRLGAILEPRFDIYRELYPALKNSFNLWDNYKEGI